MLSKGHAINYRGREQKYNTIVIQRCRFKTVMFHLCVHVLCSKNFGRVLALDGLYQCAELDEFSYHEMMAHLPLFCHPNPKSVSMQ